jgi:hypothetical protein
VRFKYELRSFLFLVPAEESWRAMTFFAWKGSAAPGMGTLRRAGLHVAGEFQAALT